MTAAQARKIVEQEFEVDIAVKSRKRIYIAARSVYYHICIKYGERLTYEAFTAEIGFVHSTVINAMNVMQADLELNQWEYPDQLKICEDRAILLAVTSDAQHVKAFESIEEVNAKFKRDLYIMVAAYTKVITAYESKLKKQKIDLLKTRIDYQPENIEI